MSVGSATMVQCTSTHISSLWPRVKRRTIFLDIMFRVYKQPLTRRGQRRHRAWKNLALPRHVGGGYCVNLLVWLASFSSVTQRTHAPSPAFLCTRVPSNKPKRKLVLQQSIHSAGISHPLKMTVRSLFGYFCFKCSQVVKLIYETSHHSLLLDMY